MGADEEFFFGAGRGDVEQAGVFGGVAAFVGAGGELPGGGVEVFVAEVEEDVGKW